MIEAVIFDIDGVLLDSKGVFVKQKSSKQVVFDDNYYKSVIRQFGYSPLEFKRINFSFGKLKKEDIQRRWLCHNGGDRFANGMRRGRKAIVSTGFGLTGIPHIGTVSQIVRAVTLQKAGVQVNMVLGDLDAFNGKGTPLEKTLEWTKKYRNFARKLGFRETSGSILRSQYDTPEVLRTSYITGHYMDDELFANSMEDLHYFYYKRGIGEKALGYRAKLSLNLMIADFIHLNLENKYDYVMVMLGIDEHNYVRAATETLSRMKASGDFKSMNLELSAIYSPMIKGFYNYPKMSKSFPNSGIRVDMKPDEMRGRIMKGEGKYDRPENNVVYQMMIAASYYSTEKLKENYVLCAARDPKWKNAKADYAEMLIDICSKW